MKIFIGLLNDGLRQGLLYAIPYTSLVSHGGRCLGPSVPIVLNTKPRESLESMISPKKIAGKILEKIMGELLKNTNVHYIIYTFIII